MSLNKGIIKIRKLNKWTTGLTLPAECIKDLNIDCGLYNYTFVRKDGELILKMELIQKESENN